MDPTQLPDEGWGLTAEQFRLPTHEFRTSFPRAHPAVRVIVPKRPRFTYSLSDTDSTDDTDDRDISDTTDNTES